MNGELPPCILFDLDGTLVESLAGIEDSVRSAFASCGLRMQVTSLRDLVGPPIRTILSRAGNVIEEQKLDALEREFRANYDREGWRNSVCFPGVPEVLRKLGQQGHRLFVVSNKPRHACTRILHSHAILDDFEDIITRDSRSPNYESKRQMIETLLCERSLAPDQCLMVGDTSEDRNAAASVGIRFVWMKYGYGSPCQFTSNPPAFALQEFSQLLSLTTKEPVLD
jgi:phosphoglycolate phosphatase